MFVGSFGVIVNTCSPGWTLGNCDYSLLEDLAVEVLGLVLLKTRRFRVLLSALKTRRYEW